MFSCDTTFLGGLWIFPLFQRNLALEIDQTASRRANLEILQVLRNPPICRHRCLCIIEHSNAKFRALVRPVALNFHGNRIEWCLWCFFCGFFADKVFAILGILVVKFTFCLELDS